MTCFFSADVCVHIYIHIHTRLSVSPKQVNKTRWGSSMDTPSNPLQHRHEYPYSDTFLPVSFYCHSYNGNKVGYKQHEACQWIFRSWKTWQLAMSPAALKLQGPDVLLHARPRQFLTKMKAEWLCGLKRKCHQIPELVGPRRLKHPWQHTTFRSDFITASAISTCKDF